ncbi:hypothetical protein THRCLA_21126 [Thraustotheca clavata]|uniref:Essential protein Yae1 N-terminal domain-containing protein n=1 Tax=Thraustotheca clavata TaxID=74557 RepID=A0A1W0A0P8_9STRA|nr:hypothetical protein THRCLA_21126 [Thraustotheca clavata]
MDVFEMVDQLEEVCIDEGYAEGIEEGRRLGYTEGKDLGEVKGYEIGNEVGFYYGCYLLWTAMMEKEKDFFSTRAVKAIESLGKQIEEYELVNSLDEKLHLNLQRIRAKFKVVTAVLGQNGLVFNEQNVLDHKNMSF